jgi:Ca-activated chloride channel family protein
MLFFERVLSSRNNRLPADTARRLPKGVQRHQLLNEKEHKHSLFGHLLLWSSILMLIAAAVTAFQANADTLDEVHGPQLYFNGAGSNTPAVQLKTDLEITVTGIVARVSLYQEFENDSDSWVEANYVLPLPEQASVSYLEMLIGERKIVAEVQEKKLAQKIYQKAKESGQKAAIMEQHRPNLFQQKIANIGPKEKIALTVVYQMPVKYQHPNFSLSIPTTLTPRYQPSAAASEGQKPTNVVDHPIPQWEYNQISQNQMSVRVNILNEQIAKISGSYDITQKANSSDHQIGTVAERVPMDRDFALEWQLPEHSEPKAQLYIEEVGQSQYGLLLVTPPSQDMKATAQEITFIIDTSGSMAGESIEQAKSAISFAIGLLDPEDQFNIIEFNSRPRALFSSARPATIANQDHAVQFIDKLVANGGTDMLPALDIAIKAPITNDQAVQQIVFITDGSVSNEQQLLDLIYNKLGNTRLFTVAIGSAPNGFFMRKAAQFGRGSFETINAVDQVQERMEQLFSKLENTIVKSPRIIWPVGVDAWPKRIPDLYHAEPLVVAVKFTESVHLLGDANIDVRGDYSDGGIWSDTISMQVPKIYNDTGISKLWAQANISHWLDQKYTGLPEDAVRAEVLPIALEHQIISPYTSMIAVEQTISRPSQEGIDTAKVSHNAPQGSTMVNAPRTATHASLQILLGLVFLLAGLLIHFRGGSCRSA